MEKKLYPTSTHCSHILSVHLATSLYCSHVLYLHIHSHSQLHTCCVRYHLFEYPSIPCRSSHVLMRHLATTNRCSHVLSRRLYILLLAVLFGFPQISYHLQSCPSAHLKTIQTSHVLCLHILQPCTTAAMSCLCILLSGFGSLKQEYCRQLSSSAVVGNKIPIIVNQEHFILRSNSYKISQALPSSHLIVKPATNNSYCKGRAKGVFSLQ